MSLNKYFLYFFLICLSLSLVAGVLAALLPLGIGGVLTALPYLIAMIIVLYIFLKKQLRAPTPVERQKLSLGYTLIFWGYNLTGVCIGIAFFSRKDPQIWQSFLLYLQQPKFLMTIFVMILLLAIPLYLITYWFYGQQAQRMAAKMFDSSFK